jgi:hypothetical protein
LLGWPRCSGEPSQMTRGLAVDLLQQQAQEAHNIRGAVGRVLGLQEAAPVRSAATAGRERVVGERHTQEGRLPARRALEAGVAEGARVDLKENVLELGRDRGATDVAYDVLGVAGDAPDERHDLRRRTARKCRWVIRMVCLAPFPDARPIPRTCHLCWRHQSATLTLDYQSAMQTRGLTTELTTEPWHRVGRRETALPQQTQEYPGLAGTMRRRASGGV